MHPARAIAQPLTGAQLVGLLLLLFLVAVLLSVATDKTKRNS